MADRLLTVDDCCRVILEGWPWRRVQVSPKLRGCKQRLLTLMAAWFGVAWDDEWGEHDTELAVGRPLGLPLLAFGMPAGYGRLRSPFDGFIEYLPQPLERAALEAHTGALRGRVGLLRTAWVALFQDALLVCWPDAGNRTTTCEQLHANGLPDAVDELDFF